MNARKRTLRILRNNECDTLPVVHFGFWREALHKWADEGHLTHEEAAEWKDGNPIDRAIGGKLGFDFNWYTHTAFRVDNQLFPLFERKVIEKQPDGFQKVLNTDGVVVLEKPGTVSIPSEVDHLLKGRREWEEHYKPRLQYDDERIRRATVYVGEEKVLFYEDGLEYLKNDTDREDFLLYRCGSLIGQIRNFLGFINLSYLLVDDEPLFTEIVDTIGELTYRCTEKVLAEGARFDVLHFWEDIAGSPGPLITPSLFEEKIGPHYKRITELAKRYGITLASVDSDGDNGALVPMWLNNGVTIMFPIEVGKWQGSIKKLRDKYGKEVRGVGGMNKHVFAQDFATIDKEIERLKPLVDLGGYIPCPDHRIPSDAIWENVQYYCEKIREM